MPENRLKQGFSTVSAHKRTPLQSNSAAGFVFFARIVATQAENQFSSFFRQIGNQLDVADGQRKLKLVFQPGFLQHI